MDAGAAPASAAATASLTATLIAPHGQNSQQQHYTHAFEALLRHALRVSAEHRNLPNEVMRERAEWLLATADDLF